MNAKKTINRILTCFVTLSMSFYYHCKLKPTPKKKLIEQYEDSRRCTQQKGICVDFQ